MRKLGFGCCAHARMLGFGCEAPIAEQDIGHPWLGVLTCSMGASCVSGGWAPPIGVRGARWVGRGPDALEGVTTGASCACSPPALVSLASGVHGFG